MSRILLPLFILFGQINYLIAQNCAPSLACFNAPLVCGNSLDGLIATTGGPNDITQPAEFCGVIENNQWIRFSACESTVSLGFDIFNCAGTFTGTGIQAEIFETSDCQSFNSVSDCYSTSDASGGTLTATGLVPGQSYFLMVDGWAGDICQYQINVLGGIDTAPPTPQEISPGMISGPAVVCPNETATYTAVLPQCGNTSNSGCPLPVLPPSDFTYTWNLPPDATLISQNGAEITVAWGTVGGTIDVQVTENNTSSNCDCDYSCGTDIPPIDVTVNDMPDNVVTLPTVYICEGESYNFCGIDYNTTIDAMCTTSCQTAEIQPIVVLPLTEVNLGTITNCNGDCYEINGAFFCDEGDFSVTEQGPDGCQTSVFSIENTDLTGFAEGGEVLTPTVISTEIGANGYSINEPVTYEWTGPDIDASNMNEQNPTVSLPGSYMVTITDASGECSIEFTVIVYQQEDDCNLPVPPADDCVLAPVFCGEQLDGYCSSTDGFTSAGNDMISDAFCASVEQSQYLRFIACESTVSLELNVPECMSGTGVEVGLFSGECGDLASVSNCDAILLLDTLIITANDLIPGELYFLVVDGIAGAECTWEVAVVEGISTDPVELQELTQAYIEGDNQVCRGDTTEYLLFPKECDLIGGCPALSNLTDSFLVTWFYPTEAIVVDSTGLTLSLVWSSGAGGTVSAVFISAFGDAGTNCGNEVECSGSAEFYTEVLYEEITLPTVYRCVGESYDFCGETITETATRTCQDGCNLTFQTVEFSSPTVIELDTIQLCPGDCYDLDGIAYCDNGFFEIETVNGVCPDIYRFTIEILNEPEISVEALETSCDGTGTNYIVGFDITDGVEPFYLNGFLMQSTSFISNPILSGDAYNYMITDSRMCGTDTELIMGADTCLCTSYAGTMMTDTLFSCQPEVLSATHLADEVMDLDDNFEYILHDSSVDTIGEIFAISKEPDFNFLSTMTIGEVYYISYVVANEIDGGFIDLSDRCLSVSVGQPVVWYAEPSVEVPTLLPLDCNNTSLELNAETSTGSEFTPQYEWTFPDGEINTELSLTSSLSGFYSLIITDTKTGCTATDTVTIFEDFSIPEVTITGDIANCANPTSEIAVTTNIENFTLMWNDQNDTDLGDTPSITGSYPNIYTANITGENGCLGSENYEVIGDFIEPEITVTGGILNCYSPSLQLQSSTNIPNPEYAWASDSFNSDLAEPTVSLDGTYTLTITNPENGCTNESTAIVEDLIIYPDAFASLDTVSCGAQSLSLLGLGTSEGDDFSYEWTSNNNSNIENNTSLSPTVFESGLYELNVINTENGCTNTAQVAADFNDFSIPEVAITGNATNCANPSSEIIVTTDIDIFTLSWNDQDGTPLGNTTSITGSYPNTYTANVIGENGCLGFDNYEIIGDFTEPDISVTGGILDCYAPNLQLQSTTNIANPAYAWTGGSFSSDLAQPTVSTEGAYTLTITNPENGCTNEAVATVEDLIVYPEVSASVDTILTCIRQSLPLSGQGTSEGDNFSYEWTSDNNLNIENNTSLSPTVFAAGFYELSVLNIENGCISSAQIEVEQEADVPVNILHSTTPPTCYGDADAIFSVVEIEGGIPPYIYSLSGFSDGQNTDWFNLSSGNYTIQIQDANGCLLKEDILINDPPLVAVDLGPDRNIDYGESITLTPSLSIDPTYVYWQSSDLQTFEERQWEISPFSTTNYEIEISDANGCIDTDSVLVRVNREIPVFIPTAFSPNNDGNNDIFFVNTDIAVAEINQMNIFDRWGNVVFSKVNFLPNDPNFGWNGRYNGKNAASGVYVWALSLSLTDGTVLKLSGDVMIMR